MDQAQNEKFHRLLADFDTAVLITHASGNTLHARPMVIARVDENCDLWFIASQDSAKANEIDVDTRAYVVCQNGRSSCVYISGHATVDYDRTRVRELWNTSLQAWFPQGLNDPNLVAIHVVGQQGEYWDGAGENRITHLYETLKAIVTDAMSGVKPGDQHGQVTLEK